MTDDLYQTLEEIDDSSWIIGRLTVSRHSSRPSGPCWDDGKEGFFAISETPSPKPTTRPPSGSCPVIHVGRLDFQFGHGLLRVQQNVGTPEHIALEELAKKSLSFQIPKVHYHGVHGDLYYIVHSFIPQGQNLIYAWPRTKDRELRVTWALQIADAYLELAQWPGTTITGIDGDVLCDAQISNGGYMDKNAYDPDDLRQNYEECGIDCSDLVFSHNSLQPLAFTVDENGLLGISLWDESGFVPRDWIRTKTRFNSFVGSWPFCKETWTEKDLDDWTFAIDIALNHNGFGEFWQEHGEWRQEMLAIRNQARLAREI